MSNSLPLVYYPGGEIRMQYWPEEGLTTREDGIQLVTQWGSFEMAKAEVECHWSYHVTLESIRYMARVICRVL